MYGVSGKITAQKGQREALLALMLNGITDMEGCYVYILSRATDDEDSIWVTEVWRSQADHQASLTLEATKALITLARPLIAGMSERVEFEPVGGIGIASGK